LSFSFFLDKDLINALRSGDVIYVARTSCCGLGVSAIRQGRLIFAVGEISAVPLGSGIDVDIPMDLMKQAQEVFRQRDPGFKFPEWPLEVRSREKSSILFHGSLEKDGYQVHVLHGFRPGEPGLPECVAISLDSACNWVAASSSAQLLEMDESFTEC
jgi:hypothetical protein